MCASASLFHSFSNSDDTFANTGFLSESKSLVSHISVDANQWEALRLYHSANIQFIQGEGSGGREYFNSEYLKLM